jgi:hypothetical protein
MIDKSFSQPVEFISAIQWSKHLSNANIFTHTHVSRGRNDKNGGAFSPRP